MSSLSFFLWTTLSMTTRKAFRHLLLPFKWSSASFYTWPLTLNTVFTLLLFVGRNKDELKRLLQLLFCQEPRFHQHTRGRRGGSGRCWERKRHWLIDMCCTDRTRSLKEKGDEMTKPLYSRSCLCPEQKLLKVSDEVLQVPVQDLPVLLSGLSGVMWPSQFGFGLMRSVTSTPPVVSSAQSHRGKLSAPLAYWWSTHHREDASDTQSIRRFAPGVLNRDVLDCSLIFSFFQQVQKELLPEEEFSHGNHLHVRVILKQLWDYSLHNIKDQHVVINKN